MKKIAARIHIVLEALIQIPLWSNWCGASAGDADPSSCNQTAKEAILHNIENKHLRFRCVIVQSQCLATTLNRMGIIDPHYWILRRICHVLHKSVEISSETTSAL